MPKTIRGKLLVVIVIITAFATISTTVALYIKASDIIKKNYILLLYNKVSYIIDSLDSDIQDIYYLSNKIVNDDSFNNVVYEYSKDSDNSDATLIFNELKDYSVNYSQISSMYLLIPEKRIVITSEDYPIYSSVDDNIINFISEKGKEISYPIIMDNFVNTTGKNITYIDTLRDSYGNIFAYLLTNVDERILYYKYLKLLIDKNVSNIVMFDYNNEVIAYNNDEITSNEFDITENIDKKIIVDKGKNIDVFYKGIFSGIGIYMNIEQDELLQELKDIQYYYIGIFFIIIAIVIIFAVYITQIINRPIKKLAETVESVRNGDLSVRAPVYTSDEIGVFSKEFNNTLDYIEQLIQQVIVEEQKKKNAELEALQYQITPHFMYNTLNSIKFAVLIKGEKEIGNLIGDFVELLQATINKKGTFITVADEIHILKNYVHLQQFRHQGLFKVIYNITPEAERCYIPRLILQPLIENSILHGIDIKKGDGVIIINSYVKDNMLYLTVEDNGKGMSDEQLKTILVSSVKKSNGLSSIGISNIRERIELYYNKRGGIQYEKLEKGLKVCIYIPVN